MPVVDLVQPGAGFGTDAQRVLLRFAFNAVGLNRVWLTAYASNPRAMRSYEKLGFRHEGLMRQSWRGPNGLEDSVLMAILRDEWEAAQARRRLEDAGLAEQRGDL